MAIPVRWGHAFVTVFIGSDIGGTDVISCFYEHRGWLSDLVLLKIAGVAQSVEQLICNQQVAGSSPIASSTC